MLNAWVDPGTGRQVKRPKEAAVEVAPRLREGFFLSFGREALYVDHLLRGYFFLFRAASLQ